MHSNTISPSQARNGDWLQTFTGIRFWPLDPRPEEIHINDIAHALAMQCRFAGHSKQFYSIAEHSVHVSYLCDPGDELWGLLHDASEAYLCDLARPTKHLPVMGEYQAAEKRLQQAIAECYGLSSEMPESVKFADNIMVSVEARELMAPLDPDWDRWLVPTSDLGMILGGTRSPAEAEAYFLARFQELNGSREVKSGG